MTEPGSSADGASSASVGAAAPVLDGRLVARLLVERGATGRITVLAQCDSTNRVAAGLPPASTELSGWAAVAADRQTAGRGRLDRQWQSPGASGLMFSVLVDAGGPSAGRSVPLAPLASGVGTVRACRDHGAAVGLKWPNDVIADGERGPTQPWKAGGILVELVPRGIVMGVGLNVDLEPQQAPVPQAVGLRSLGLTPGLRREELLADVVLEIVAAWAQARRDRAALLAEYRRLCRTVGAEVAVVRADGSTLRGTATAVDDDGHLLVARPAEGRVERVTVGDVVHLRSARM